MNWRNTKEEDRQVDYMIQGTGRWKTHHLYREWDVCSACGFGCKRREYGLNDDGTEWKTEYSYQYCPWCGAKMEGGAE